MVDNWTYLDPAVRLRILVAGALTSGVLVTGMAGAPLALATCSAAAAETGCPSSAEPEELEAPTQAEIDVANRAANAAQDEANRLKDIAGKAHWALDDAMQLYGKNEGNQHYKAKLDAFNDAQRAVQAAELRAAIEKDRAQVLADRFARAAKDAAERQEAADLAGPAKSEVDEADRAARAADDEQNRLNDIAGKADKEFRAAQNLYGKDSGDPRVKEKERAYVDAVNAIGPAREAFRTASARARTLRQKFDEAAAKRAATQEADKTSGADKKGARQQGADKPAGPTAAQVTEANTYSQATRAEADRLKAIDAKARQDLDQAEKQWGAAGTQGEESTVEPRLQQARDSFESAHKAYLAAEEWAQDASDHVRTLADRSGTWAGPTPADLSDVNDYAQITQVEADRLKAIDAAARQHRDDAEQLWGPYVREYWGGISIDHRLQTARTAYDAAHNAYVAADDKAHAARDRARTLAEKSGKWAGPTQADMDEVNGYSQATRAEADRLKAIDAAARERRDDTARMWGAAHPYSQDAVDNYNRAHEAYQAAEDRAWIAGARAKTLTEKFDATADERAAKEEREEAEKREADKWGGPTAAELKQAIDISEAARAEATRLNDVDNKAIEELNEAKRVYGDNSSDPTYQEKVQAKKDAFYASEAAERKAQAAERLAANLIQKSEQAAWKKANHEDADWRESIRWGGPTETQVEEATNDSNSAHRAGERRQADVDRAQRALADAQKTYGADSKDPRYLKKARAYDEAKTALAAARERESETAERVSVLNYRVALAAARRAQEGPESEAERQEAKNLAGPPASEIDLANKAAQVSKDTAARLHAAADKAKRELADAEKTYGANSKDSRYQDKLRASRDAAVAEKAAHDQVAADAERAAVLKSKADRAAARRAAIAEADKQRVEAAANPSELERLSVKAAKAWTELHHATEVYGPSSQDPRYLEKLRAYDEASKALKPVADKAEADAKSQSATDKSASQQPDKGQADKTPAVAPKPDAPSTNQKAPSTQTDASASRDGTAAPSKDHSDGKDTAKQTNP